MKRLSAVRSIPSKVLKAFSTDIARKIIYTVIALVIYRLLASVPLPGVDPLAFRDVVGNNPFSNIFTLISGGRLDQPSLVAIGIAPYINASIIIQLLTTIVPKLEELSKQGETGKRVLNQYTRFLTLPLAIMQSIMIYTILTNPELTGGSVSGVLANLSVLEIVVFTASVTAGSMILMWLAELINEKGIGNGASLIIALGIIASLPSLAISEITGLSADWANFVSGDFQSLLSTNFQLFYILIALTIAMVGIIVIVNEAKRKVNIVYSRRFGTEGADQSYLPLKLNQAGVMPVIFAQAMLTFPLIISSFILSIRDSGRLFDFATSLNNSSILSANNPQYLLLLGAMVLGFAFFYTYVVVKPEELAKNLQKSGAFIPGIRPGNGTIRYLNLLTAKLTLFGGIFLAAITALPYALQLTNFAENFTVFSVIGGTGLLIVVSVFMDIYRQYSSLKTSQNYEIFS